MWKSPAIAAIVTWAKPVYRSILWICLFNFILSGSSLVITVATKGLIDGASSHNLVQVKGYAILLIAAVVVIRVGTVLSNLISVKANAVLLRDLREMVLHKLLRKEYRTVEGYHSGELVNRMFSDASVVKNGIMTIVPQLIFMAISFCGAAVILISMDWRFVILLIVGGLTGLILSIGFKKPMSERHRNMQEKEGKLHAVLQESLGNLRFIKATGLEIYTENQSSAAQQEFLAAQLHKGYFSTVVNSCINTVFQVSWLFCMIWGGRGIYRGVLTYGSLAAVIQLIGQIQRPIAAVADLAAQAYGTISSAERLKELLDLPEEENIPQTDCQKIYQKLQMIALKDVSFDYDREPVLRGVCAKIHKGDFVAVTGVSGSGKSTLFQLMLGIYQPGKGKVEFVLEDGTVSAAPETRALFAYVPQGNILFSGTLRENLLMFREDATEEELRSAIQAACIDGLVDQLEDGLETMLGERGVGLSEGQAQRVAVARALLSRAPVLLLDESTSALDEETEAKLLSNISHLKEKTCLIVTHRQAALQICDFRLHIEHGRARIIPLTGKKDGNV